MTVFCTVVAALLAIYILPFAIILLYKTEMRQVKFLRLKELLPKIPKIKKSTDLEKQGTMYAQPSAENNG